MPTMEKVAQIKFLQMQCSFLSSVLYSQAPESALHFGMAGQQRDQPPPLSGGKGVILLLSLM